MTLDTPPNFFSLWIQAARPKTLTAAWVPVVVGTALARSSTGEVHWGLALCALGSSLFIQIATNFLNDAIDHQKGADTAKRLGPTRVTASGWVSPQTVFRAGFFCLLLAFLLGIPLILKGGWPLVGIGLLSLFFAYGYTGGPFPLAYLGLGDLFVYLFFGLIAVGGTYYLHTGEWGAPAFLAGTQVGLLATVLIAINNFRDAAEDRGTGKRTLAVRFGDRFARLEITFLLLAPFGIGVWNWYGHQPWAALLPFLSLPLALRVLRGVWTEKPSPRLNQFLALSAGVHLLFGILLSIGLLRTSS